MLTQSGSYLSLFSPYFLSARSYGQQWLPEADRKKGQQRTTQLCLIYRMKCLCPRLASFQRLLSASTQSYTTSNVKVQSKLWQNGYTTTYKLNALSVAVAQPRKIHPKNTLTHTRVSIPPRDPTNLPLVSGKSSTRAAGIAEQPPPLHRPEIQFQQQSSLSVTAGDRGHVSSSSSSSSTSEHSSRYRNSSSSTSPILPHPRLKYRHRYSSSSTSSSSSTHEHRRSKHRSSRSKHSHPKHSHQRRLHKHHGPPTVPISHKVQVSIE